MKRKQDAETQIAEVYDIIDVMQKMASLPKLRHVKKLRHKLQPYLVSSTDPAGTVKLYVKSRALFNIAARVELKVLDANVDKFRMALYGHGEVTKAEKAYREDLELLLHNHAFLPKEILRHYRMAEQNINKVFTPNFVSLFVFEDQDAVIESASKETDQLQTAETRCLAYPEDSILIELAPHILVERARLAGVIAPELLPFEDLSAAILSIKTS